MHMVVVVIADRSHRARLIGANLRAIVSMVVTVFVAVVSEMCGLARRVFQSITNAHRSRVGGVQRKYDGKNKREASAHGREAYQNTGLA